MSLHDAVADDLCSDLVKNSPELNMIKTIIKEVFIILLLAVLLAFVVNSLRTQKLPLFEPAGQESIKSALLKKLSMVSKKAGIYSLMPGPNMNLTADIFKGLLIYPKRNLTNGSVVSWKKSIPKLALLPTVRAITVRWQKNWPKSSLWQVLRMCFTCPMDGETGINFECRLK
jgi:hypothetical protein